MSTRATARARTADAPVRRHAPARDRHEARPRPRAVPRRTVQRRRLGLLIIPLIAIVLGGIVWINVAKLTLTNETGKVIERARVVEGQTARLKSDLEQRNAAVRRNAQNKLGMVSPEPDSVTYLDPSAAP